MSGPRRIGQHRISSRPSARDRGRDAFALERIHQPRRIADEQHASLRRAGADDPHLEPAAEAASVDRSAEQSKPGQVRHHVVEAGDRPGRGRREPTPARISYVTPKSETKRLDEAIEGCRGDNLAGPDHPSSQAASRPVQLAIARP